MRFSWSHFILNQILRIMGQGQARIRTNEEGAPSGRIGTSLPRRGPRRPRCPVVWSQSQGTHPAAAWVHTSLTELLDTTVSRKYFSQSGRERAVVGMLPPLQAQRHAQHPGRPPSRQRRAQDHSEVRTHPAFPAHLPEVIPPHALWPSVLLSQCPHPCTNALPDARDSDASM